MKNFKKIGLAAASMTLAGSAFAQEAGGTVEIAGVLTAIQGVGIAAAAIGAAVLIVKVGIKAYKMIAAAL